MYWETFGFKEPPFALTPNPAFLFLSSPHQEAFAHLLFAIENRAGFIELSGEVGTGKTTIVRTLLNQLDPETHRSALIFNPTLSPIGFLREVNSEFGLNCDGADMRDLHTALNGFLLEENRAGRTVVLVVDEAQNLSVEVLEHIRLISNLETDSAKLIQIVLVGQPELNALLSKAELRQLDQRITVRYHLKPMCFDDTCAYIRHRIRFAADGREPLTFSQGALRKVYRFSGGLPRLINGVCDRALLLAYTREVKEVSPSMAELSIADLRREAPRNRRAVPLKAPMAGLVLCVVVVAGFSLLSQSLLPGKPEPPAQVHEVPALSRDAALRSIAALSEQENLHAAVNAVLAAWQVRQVQPVPGQATSLRTLARQRGLTTTKVAGDLEALARLDAPALLHVTVPGGGERLVALVGLNRDEIMVVPSVAGKARLTRAELAQFWSGGATLLWKDFHGISTRTRPADRTAVAKLVQGLLKQAGCYDGPINGNIGKMTLASLTEFQRREGLSVDGQASGETLMMLYRRAGGFFPPALDGGGVQDASAGSQGVGRIR